MIYEIRTYQVKPGQLREYENRFAEAYPTRAKYSPLLGYWHTEIGPLNQLVHIWPYQTLQERADAREAAGRDPSGKWPPGGADLLVSQENDILIPVPGMPELKGDQQWGNLYELRMYTYPAGEVPKVAEAFGAALAARAELYPVAGIWTSDLGNLNRLYQLFPYKNWDHRDEVRAQYRKSGIWPPHTEARPIAQLVRHLIPTSFSPLH
jgi:hypothetical protein